MRLSVLQWNIWHLEKVENIISVLKKYQPDIICLQEVVNNAERNNYKNVAQSIADEIGYELHFAIAYTDSETKSELGNAILTKSVQKNKTVFFIKNDSTGSSSYAGEPRICMTNDIDTHIGKSITIATTHASYEHAFEDNSSKKAQVNRLIKFVDECENPLILTGDLNLPPNSDSIQRLSAVLRNAGPAISEKTWTTKPFSHNGFEETNLNWRLDYIFVSKDIKVISSQIINIEYSDHLPILAELETI